MSHTVIECPGCLSKLRFRSASKRESIDCPRCSEKIVIADAVKQPSASPKRAPRRPAPQPVPAAPPADDYVDDFIDEDEARAKKESIVFLGFVGVAILTALIAFPSAIYYLLKDDPKEPQNVADASTSTELDASAETNPAGTKPPIEPNIPPTNGDNQQPPAETPQPAPEIARTEPAKPKAKIEPAPDSDTVPKPVEPPVVPAPIIPAPTDPPPAVAAAPKNDDGRLRYHWTAGQEHIYQLKITADHGGTKENITGSCTYTVKSNGREHDEEREGSGSGFVVASNGVIATCAHVVEGAKRIEVTIGEKTYQARVIVEKGKLDLALIKIDANALPVSQFADSDKVQLAERVRALGFPMSTILGTSIKVATGEVAGLTMHPLHGKQIQTDAPVNPGNSGGPIVNESGQVIGVVSSKIAPSAASSVGFAVPINELKKVMTDHGLTPPGVRNLPKLSGPEIAKTVTPTVAFIKVWGSSGGKVFDVAFNASFTQSQSFDPRRMRFGAFPVFPSSSHDRGNMKVNANGEVVEFSGEENLPYVLGPLGQFFIEPLDPYGDQAWSNEYQTTLRIVKREANDPISQMRSRMGPIGPRGRFGGFGGFDPFGDKPEPETIKEYPARQSTSYRVGQELNNRITIHKTFEFVTTKNPQRPFLSVKGSGDIVFDKKLGMPSTLEFKATLTQVEDGGKVAKLPITVSYNLRDPAVVKKEREAALQRHEEQKKQQEIERTTPNPDLVDQVLADIRKEEGGFGSYRHLQRLSKIAIVPEKREEVLEVVTNHRKNSNSSVQGAAAEAFCRWCTEESVDEVWQIASDKNSALHTARKIAVAKLIEFDKPDLYEKLIALMNNISMRHDIKRKLQSAKGNVEQAVLDKIDSVSDRSVKRDLVEVLQKVGTEKSVALLESYVNGGDSLLKYAAQRALDAVRGRM